MKVFWTLWWCMGHILQQGAWRLLAFSFASFGLALLLVSYLSFTCMYFLISPLSCLQCFRFAFLALSATKANLFSPPHMPFIRKALQEPNPSDSAVYRLYVIVIVIYASLQFFLSFLMRIPFCHRLTNQCDHWPVIRFLKWMRQVFLYSDSVDFGWTINPMHSRIIY